MPEITANPRRVSLYKDVGFDRTYKHVIYFDNSNERDSYFAGLPSLTFIENANYIPKDGLLKLYVGENSSAYYYYLEYTYCSFIFGNKNLYFFIDDVVVINPSTIGFKLIPDVWTTYMFNSEGNRGYYIGESSIEREHVDRWISSSEIPVFKKVVAEDTNISIYNKPSLKKLKANRLEVTEIATCFISYVTTGQLNNIVVPFLIPGTLPLGIACTPYDSRTQSASIFTSSDIASGKFLSTLGITPESVTSLSITASQSFAWLEEYDSIGMVQYIYPSSSLLDFHTTNNYGYYIIPRSISPSNASQMVYRVVNTDKSQIKIEKEWHKPTEFTNQAPTLASIEFEPIMWTYPYVDRCIIDYAGGRAHHLSDDIVYKDYDGLMLRLLIQSSGTSVAVYLTRNFGREYNEFIETNLLGSACVIASPTIDVPSNTWLSYVNTSRTTDRELVMSQSIQSAIESVASGLTLGLATGNPIIGAVGTIGGPIEAGFNFANQEIKEKSIRNMAQSLLFDGTGDSVMQTSNLWLQLSIMECNDTVRDIAYDRYMKFGYKVNRIGVPNVKTRKYFNFIKTNFCQIEGTIPNRIKVELETIFNNGVTIWHFDNLIKNTDNVLAKDYSYENIERSLIQ